MNDREILYDLNVNRLYREQMQREAEQERKIRSARRWRRAKRK